MGATEKRRESGAGVAVIGDIGGSGLGGAGRWGSLSGMVGWVWRDLNGVQTENAFLCRLNVLTSI